MKSILLIGVNRFGSLIAEQFHKQGHQVLAVDKKEERINCILPFVTDAVIGDSTNEAFLKSLGINNFDVCIVTIDEVQTKFLLRNGADEVINPEKQIAEWAAIRYASDHILDYIRLDEDYAIFEVKIPREWSGKSIGQIDIRKKYGITIMAVKENGKMNLSVTPDIVLDSSKTMLVLGKQKAIQKRFHI